MLKGRAVDPGFLQALDVEFLNALASVARIRYFRVKYELL